MRLEQYDSEKLTQELRAIAGKYLDLSAYKIFFFGSRVSGAGDDRSDIDVGVEGKEPVSLTAMRSIKEDIESLPLLYKIDVVDFSLTSDSFREVAKQHIEYISEPVHGRV
ncbi:nucleotidyltransferase domain-containing protein [Candidatus Uhrbacteria bacterium]|nr:nucleotidyltransferase domain-containing protein [Candidatus Uhrbacteria bacterium]